MISNHYIMGISMSNHDRSVCLLKNGNIACAIAEERIDRRKRSEGFYGIQDRGIVLPPLAAIRYVLNKESINLKDVELFVCGRSILPCKDAFLQYVPVESDKVVEIPIPGHHKAHAYSAYATSPFRDSAVMVIDEQGHSIGENAFEKCSWYEGVQGPLKQIHSFFGSSTDLSLGMFYDAFASFVGLSEAHKPSAGKLMGLAPYGKFHSEWPELIVLKDNGDTNISLTVLDEFFSMVLQTRHGMKQFEVQKLDDLLIKYIPTSWNSELGSDLAFKAQNELEKAILYISSELFKRSNFKTLAYAGGIALNCTTNRKLLQTGWLDVYIHPAATDDGVAIGLAMYGWIEILGKHRLVNQVFNPFTGIAYRKNEVLEAVKMYGLENYIKVVDPSQEGALLLAEKKIVCWFQGSSEWGPRALGARSIVANPLHPNITNVINSRIKFREKFRPFGISGIQQGLDNLLELQKIPKSLAPFMLAVGNVKSSLLSQVTHVDGTVRFQIVDPNLQSVWYRLIENFGAHSGVYAVLNTSFNVLGEPLVESPTDALRQFFISGADALIIEDFMIVLEDIPKDLIYTIVKRAFKETRIHPLKFAIGLESAGYPEEAFEQLKKLNYNEKNAFEDGLVVYQNFHLFMARMHLRNGETEVAVNHAYKFLKWSGLPFGASFAANILSEYSSNENTKKVGQLCRSVVLPGELLRFFEQKYEDIIK